MSVRQSSSSRQRATRGCVSEGRRREYQIRQAGNERYRAVKRLVVERESRQRPRGPCGSSSSVQLKVNSGMLLVPVRRRMAAAPVREIHEAGHQHDDRGCHSPTGGAVIQSLRKTVVIRDWHVRSVAAFVCQLTLTVCYQSEGGRSQARDSL
jgi:hypothetical protein